MRKKRRSAFQRGVQLVTEAGRLPPNGGKPNWVELTDLLEALAIERGVIGGPLNRRRNTLHSKKVGAQLIKLVARDGRLGSAPDKMKERTATDGDKGIEAYSWDHPVVAEFYKSAEWCRLRYKTLKKYGRRCQCCGQTPRDGVKMNVDHIKPLRFFWDRRLDPDNLQVLCSDCNRAKGNWDHTDWRAA